MSNLSRTNGWPGNLLAALITAVSLVSWALTAQAAPAAFPTVTTPVKVNGVALGDALTPNTGNSLRTAIVFDPASNLYYLWFLNADSGALSDYSLAKVSVYSSVDGINFNTSIGNLNPPASWWTAQNASLATPATSEPLTNYLRVQKIGVNWVLQVWNANDGGTSGDHNYNTTIWTIGALPGNLNITQVGPLPTLASGGPPRNVTGAGGNQVGQFGIVNGNIYLRHDSAPPASTNGNGGGLGRYAYAAGTPPSTSPYTGVDAANLFADTGWCWALDPGCVNPAANSYVHNYGRTLNQGGNVLGTYYSFRDTNTGARREKQLWYVESPDDGVNWGAPQPLFANGAAVTVDGLPNTANFSLPEVAELGGGQYRTYFSTRDACGNIVVVTAASASAQQGLTITKAFAQHQLAVGGSTTLTVTLSAPPVSCSPVPAAGAVYTAIGYTDNLPANMTLTGTPLVSNACGGTLVANANAAQFSLSGVSLNPGQSCTTVVNVKASSSGNYPNVIARALLAANGGVNNAQGVPALADATDTLTVTAAPAAVPVLEPWLLLALAGLLPVLGWRGRRQ